MSEPPYMPGPGLPPRPAFVTTLPPGPLPVVYPAPGWELERVKALDEVVNLAYYTIDPAGSFPAYVDLGKVVGTDHTDYAGGSWVAMQKQALLKPRSSEAAYVAMVRDNEDHSEASDYVPPLAWLHREPIRVHQYGDEYFLTGSGNHRLCHAKFAGVTTLRLQVTRYRL